jgi:hypothetical protein
MDKKAADRRLFCCSKWLFARTGALAPKASLVQREVAKIFDF